MEIFSDGTSVENTDLATFVSSASIDVCEITVLVMCVIASDQAM